MPRSMATAFVAVILLPICAASVSARTWYITPDGSGDAPTIQAGLNLASVGDIVELACGIYYEHDLIMAEGVTLRAAAQGCATIDAQQQGRLISCSDCQTTTAIEGVTFTGGEAYVSGGSALYCSNSLLTIADCSFTNNRVYDGAGGSVTVRSSSVSMTGCVVSGNQNWSESGGLSSTESTVLIVDSLFENNLGTEAGALYCSGGSMSITGCTLDGNNGNRVGSVRAIGATVTVDETVFTGGGFGVFWSQSCDLSISNSVFGNSYINSGSPGVLRVEYGTASIAGCTFAHNTKEPYDYWGAHVINVAGSHLSMENTIIAFNGPDNFPPLACEAGGSVTAVCCDIFGNDGGDWIGCLEGQGGSSGNFSADPLFCGSVNGDLTLQAVSPCAPPGITGCGLVGALDVGCGSNTLSVALDIKPTSCPNPLNPGSQGLIPTAILGASDFDVTAVDVSTLLLVLPAGTVTPIPGAVEDVAAPVVDAAAPCDCTMAGPDGFADLTLMFDSIAVYAALGQVVSGQVIELCVTGQLLDGTPFEGCDCIRVTGPVSIESRSWASIKALYR